MSGIKDAVELVKEATVKWHEPIGLLIALAAVTIVSTLIPAPAITRIVIGAAIALGVLVSWVYTRRTPKAAVNRVGIAIAVTADRSDEIQFANDFAGELNLLLQRSRVGHTFQIVKAPLHIVRNIDLADKAAVAALRLRMRCAFILAGKVRVRMIGGKDHLVLDLVGGVGHRPISAAVQDTFSREFGELMPSRIAMPADQDLLAFSLTGQWMTVVAQYVIGIAAALSGDLAYAQTLYMSAREGAAGALKENPAAQKITARIPVRLAELDEARANAALERWKQTRSKEAAAELKGHLANIEPALLSGPRYANLRAIASFLVDRDADAALRQLEGQNGKDNAEKWLR